jgi:hypothetical protein
MDPTELLRASRREGALYRQLIELYRTLRTGLAGVETPADPAWVATQQARAEAVATELRSVGAVLASDRLTGASVPSEVRDLWRESAGLAAEAVDANAEVTALARARRSEAAARLVALQGRRRGLAAYRPRSESRPALTA